MSEFTPGATREITPEEGEQFIAAVDRFDSVLHTPRAETARLVAAVLNVSFAPAVGGVDREAWFKRGEQDINVSKCDDIRKVTTFEPESLPTGGKLLVTEKRYSVSPESAVAPFWPDFKIVLLEIDPESGEASILRSESERALLDAVHKTSSDEEWIATFIDGMHDQKKKVEDLEAITGINSRTFTPQRLQEVLGLLAGIDPSEAR